jgi:hypothetical protein
MVNNKFAYIFFLVIIFISFTSARLEVGLVGESDGSSIGLDLNLNPLDINYGGNYSINVNSSDKWITNEGVLDNVVDISHNWLNPSSLLWSVAAHIMDTFLDMNGYNINMESGNITNASVITVEDRYAFNDTPTTYMTKSNLGAMQIWA